MSDADTIQLDEHFPMHPLAAIKDATRCDQVADHFAAKAADPYDLNREGAAALRDEYRARAARIRQIAQPTAERMKLA